MGKKTKSAPDGFPKKLYKLLGEGVAEEMNAMGAKQLDAAIVTAEEQIEEVEKAKAADEELADLRAQVKDATGPYTDAIKAQKAKVKYALYLKEQG